MPQNPTSAINSQYARAAVNRRTMLKSTGALLGASVLRMGVPNSSAQQSGHNTSNGALRKNKVGFMLAHEQFTVPELVEIGVAAEQADSICWRRALTSSHGNPMRDIPDWPG